jgi:hypothetical protein
MHNYTNEEPVSVQRSAEYILLLINSVIAYQHKRYFLHTYNIQLINVGLKHQWSLTVVNRQSVLP